MIVFYNICDHCSNQTQIEDDKNDYGIEFHFYSYLISTKERRDNWSKRNVGTFCNKECLLEYLKNNLDNKGKVKGESKEDEKSPF